MIQLYPLRRLAPFLCALGGTTLVACLGVEKHEDLGQACLGEPQPWDSGDALSIQAGDSTAVTVIFSECASGSVEWSKQECSVVVEGDLIEVSTTVQNTTPRMQTDDCNWVSWDCGTVELEEGSYRLVYGDAEESFEVPYDGAPICADNG